MSSARQWFSKRVHPPPPKTAKDLGCPIPPEKLPLHVDTGKPPATFKFNTLAAVMGKKPKKQHAGIPIQDPPMSPTAGIDHANSSRYTNRPPAKSISSTVRSTDESLGPKTPSDGTRDRMSFPRSVLTLSDSDPFAASGIALPHSIIDPTRLSVHSDSSFNNNFAKKSEPSLPFRHPPFASTSSHSHYSNPPPLSDSYKAQVSPTVERPAISHRTCVEQQKRASADDFTDGVWDGVRPTLSKSGSASTLTEKKCSPNSSTSSRPSSRPRGYTESGSSRSTPTMNQRARNGSMAPSNITVLFPPPQPRTLTRQLSTSKVPPVPPTAPPVHELPPPPPLTTARDSDMLDDDDSPVTFSGSGSSSSLSFASSSSSTREFEEEDYYQSRYKTLKEKCSRSELEALQKLGKISGQVHAEDIISPRSPLNSRPAPFTHCLKKSLSHQTLQKAKHGSNSISSDIDDVKDKAIRKQRSFHQSRLNAPPLPAPHHAKSANSIVPFSATDIPSPTESRQGNSSQLVRKRLFSGSKSRQIMPTGPEDDLRSIFSLPSEVERTRAAVTRTTASLLDEPMSDNMSTSTHSATDYLPQRIMSPAEMLKVEACVQSEFDAKYRDALQNRQRGISFTSASTPLLTTCPQQNISNAPISFTRVAPMRSASTIAKAPVLPRLATRPSTAQGDSISGALCSPSTTSPSSACPIIGLSPPPRPRGRPSTAETNFNEGMGSRRSSNVPFIPLTPPPPRKRTIRTSPSSEKTAPQKSMIRKPSFLDITDDGPSYENSSFLDFDSGKESLDISRDTDDMDIIR
ncbi:hypothetical protein BJ138DRAFT_1154402 [Hygrophoropsis aurantiaca]|uniref:Uncharacterized protein n=1 Tax=Hygrophoropsis aurantiaca TaxID=72124 RepID=A0ACB8A8I2_9AGAM|nr:hypothetical protein BJ138DRAFT_1154402 [Hygrophoropsis aurantiaca]